MKLFKRTTHKTAEFCDRCGSVCDAACRRDAMRDRAREQALAYGIRFS